MAGHHRRTSVLLAAGLLTTSLSGTPALQRAAAAPRALRAAQPSDAAQQWMVTLVTGDVVQVRRTAKGAYSAAVHAPTGSGRFHVSTRGDHLYVVPASVLPLVPRVLDPALFDVRGLVEMGYDDAHATALPVLVAQAGSASATRLEARTAGAVDARRVLSRSGLVAARLPKAGAQRLGDLLTTRAASDRRPAAQGRGLAGVARMWLDRPVKALWDRNLEQVGAPAAWAAGLDGTGVTVAVLDSGIDATHPDLVGKVTAAKDFTDSGSTRDGHGHGTHVAALVAGTGAGNPGVRRGVAPGAKLMVGKVLDDEGSGTESGVLAGMEWAVAEGADIVSMSLGGPPSDGTDPVSLAVNTLTAQGALFVIAAGNSGPLPMSVSTPAAADAALAVGAVDQSDQLAWFSSVGPRSRDHALKPDVTAPGVDIVSARAAGTDMGEPVDARYTKASGTSMATPMVAGAAAVLLQRHPDWTPEQLKAALAGTADPTDEFGAFEQGAGRIDLAEALDATVVPLDEDADLGLLTYPQTDVATTTAGWRNDGAAPVTLDLSLRIRGPDGATVPASAAGLSAATVTIEPGGTAHVTITADPRVTKTGDHSGYLAAVVRGTDDRLQTPVGFHDEQESYNLTVRGVNRAGGPAAGDFVSLLDVDDFTRLPWSFEFFRPDGTLTMRVPKGRYAAFAEIVDSRGEEGGEEADAISMLVEPEFTVAADTEIVLDAQRAALLTSTLDSVATDRATMVVGYTRQDAGGSSAAFGSLMIRFEVPFYVTPIPAVSVGSVSTSVDWRLIQPVVQLRTAPGGVGASGQPVRVIPVGGAVLPSSGRLTALDVGGGSQAEFDALDVRGKLAVVRRGERLVDLAARARTAGAAVLAVVNDGPGLFVGDPFPETQVPTLIVDGADAAALIATADGQPVDLTVRAHSAFAYDLHEPAKGSFRTPLAKSYTAGDRAGLARVDARYTRLPADGVIEGRGFLAEGMSFTVLQPVGRTRRTEYVTPATEVEQMVWWLYPRDLAGFSDLITFAEEPAELAPGGRTSATWLSGPLRAALYSPVVRDHDNLFVDMAETSDAFGRPGEIHHFGEGPSSARNKLSLYRNGRLVETTPDLATAFRMTRSTADYRLVADLDSRAQTPLRTRTRATWQFTSKRPTEAARVPLPVFDYDVPVDDNSRLVGQRLRVTVVPQPAGRKVVVDRFSFAFSTDGGKTWRAPEAISRHSGGRYSIRLPVLRSGAVVSFRADTKTTAGVRHIETVLRALQVH